MTMKHAVHSANCCVAWQ